MITEAGTVALALLLVNFTEYPPVTAFPERLTVPVEFVPPVTVDGLTLTSAKTAGVRVRIADWETPFRVPVIVTVL